MGLTYTEVEPAVPIGIQKRVRFKATFDATYVNGTGEVFNASDIGLSRIDRVQVKQKGGYTCEDTINTAKTQVTLKLFFGDNNNAADGPQIEAANFDASALVFEVEAWGV